MPDISYLTKIAEGERVKVLAIEDPKVDEAAKNIAYYAAMIDAAIDDPLDDTDEQEALLAYFKQNLEEHIEHYVPLVNNHL